MAEHLRTLRIIMPRAVERLRMQKQVLYVGVSGSSDALEITKGLSLYIITNVSLHNNLE